MLQFSSSRLVLIATISLAIVFLNICDGYAQKLRIATYNVNCRNNQREEILGAINAADADVVCLQETTRPLEAFLVKHLASTYPHIHSAGHQGKILAERFTIAAKYELHDLVFHPPEAGLFGFYSAELELGKERVYLVAVHLAPFLVRPGAGLRKVIGAISEAETVHAREMEAILQSVNANKPTVILGDFNSVANLRAPQQLLANGFVDAVASAHENAEAHPTWFWPTKPLPLQLRIDYIFHTSQLKTLNAKVIQRKGSDHSLIVAEVELSKTKSRSSPNGKQPEGEKD